MDRKKATDFPQELLDHFDKYVHGDISRREFLDRANKYAVGGLSAVAIWESLRPNYAFAQQVRRCGSGQGATEQEALHRRAAQAYEEVDLRLRFDAFGHHRKLQALRHRNDRASDRNVSLVPCVADKRLVELELVQWQAS